MRVPWWCFALLIVSAWPHVLLGQESGVIVGTVVDDMTGEALAGATLSVWEADVQTASDTSGIFELTPLPPGAVTVRVELPGYTALTEQVDVLPAEVGLFQFRLSRNEVALQELIVRARAAYDDGGASSFTAERASGYVLTALDLLRQQVPGVSALARGWGRDGAGMIRIRGSSSLINNEPVLYVDGVLAADGVSQSAVDVLEQLPAEIVQRIRVLHGPAAAGRYGEANNGVILVETR